MDRYGFTPKLTFALIFDVIIRYIIRSEIKGEMKMSGHALGERTRNTLCVKYKDICGGSPIIKGTRTRVIDIAIEYEMLGHSPDEIISSHPHLNLPQVHDALSFYYENKDELDQKAERDREFIVRLKDKIASKIA
jgi:uncharacterized protein (DUF433 family)